MIIKKYKKNKKLLLIFISICAIMFLLIKTYCAATITLKSITYNNKTYSFYPECIRYHVKANGYDKKLKEEVDNNLYTYAFPGPGRELQPTNAKMQGYGNYVFKEDTNLFNFINYCYTLNPQMTIACALYTGPNELSSCDYTKLCSYSGKKLNSNSMTFVNFFWTNMLAQLGETFKSYQDLYFFDKYINKGACLVYSPNRLSNNGTEFLTCMMSYLFSTNQNSASSFEVKKGDIVPFLFITDSNKIKDENGERKYNISDEIKNNPKETVKYAYVACINGWAEVTANDLWLEEYESIFGEYNEEELCENIDLGIEELETLYYEIDELYQNQKGNKGNALLGSTIDAIIQSDYSITQQLEATDYYLQIIEGIGDYKDNMTRNELMAKYMMENSHIGDTIKDYNVGITFITENLQRGTSESKNTKTAVLSDFQVLEFDHTLNNDGQSDDDGLSDLSELTNNTKWVNITGPAEKTYNDMLSKGKTTKTMNDVFEDFVKKSPGMVKYENNKLYYKTYDYLSNPMLNDTDFDGMMDNIDSNRISGNFKGNACSIGNLDFVSDFRYFFVDNEKYNDELSTMSLMMCNLANGETAPLHSGSQSISQYMSNLGFATPISEKHLFRINAIENISGNLYLSKKTIQVGANKKSVKRYKDVYGIFLGGFDTEDNYKKLLSNFDKEEVVSFYQNIAEDIISYINTNKSATVNPYCYWVTGYSIAGGIAGEVASRLANSNEVYCYTFGATNTNTTGSGAYACIKNVINEDDLYPKIYNIEDGFHRTGMLYNDSIYDNLKREYSELVGNFKNYKVTPKRTNTIKQKIQQVRKIVTKDEWINMWLTNLTKFLKQYAIITDTFNDIRYPFQSYDSTQLKTILNNNTNEVKKAHEMKSYYVLSKSLNGFDLNNEDINWTLCEDNIIYDEDVPDSEYDENVMEAISNLALWHINHIPTYQNSLSGSYAYYNDSNDIAREYFSHYATATNSNATLLTTPILKSATIQMQQNGTEHEELHRISDNRIAYRVPELENYANNKEDNINNVYGNNMYSAYTGDDCNSFVMGVIRLISEGDRGQQGTNQYRLNSTGMRLQNTSAAMMGTDDNFERAMLNLGYEKYALRDGVWKKFELVQVGDEVREEIEPLNITMSVDFLEPGDILITDGNKPNLGNGKKYGHVEFYLGYNYDVTYNNMISTDINVRKRSGIASIEIGNRATQGYNTFGWGRVFNEFPRNDSECFYLNNNGSFSICKGACVNNNGVHTGGDTRYYKEIWRKVR